MLRSTVLLVAFSLVLGACSKTGDADMGGDYLGYDGPYPPANDLRMHRYFFRLFALDLARLDVPDRFTAADVHRAMHGHVLAEAAIYGTYSLNPRVHD